MDTKFNRVERIPVNHNRTDENLKQRRQLCEDLDYLIREDAAIREELIDEFVYLLSDKRLVELQEYVNKELISDFGRG